MLSLHAVTVAQVCIRLIWVIVLNNYRRHFFASGEMSRLIDLHSLHASLQRSPLSRHNSNNVILIAAHLKFQGVTQIVHRFTSSMVDDSTLLLDFMNV